MKKFDVLKCHDCSREYIVTDDKIKQCMYCHSKNYSLNKQIIENELSVYIPFSINQTKAKNAFETWKISKRKFKNLEICPTITPIYLPYWWYEFDASCRYKANQRAFGATFDGEPVVSWRKVRGGYEETLYRIYPASHSNLHIEDLRYNKLKNLQQIHLKKITKESIVIPDISSEEWEPSIRNYSYNRFYTKVENTYSDIHSISILDLEVDITDYELLLIPVYRGGFNLNDKEVEFVIDGCNGKVYPLSNMDGGNYKFNTILGIIVAIIIILLIIFLTGDKLKI